ncbi:MAG TPA: cell division protein FtsL [Burkholderiales bacterium]|nr:cell division protein FtsL [Burkholderiales bacterium]
MTRLNFLLALTLIVCALGVVTSQHKARKLFAKLQQEQELSAQLDVEWGQLLLEQSTWATHARIEKIATEILQMRVPDGKRSQVVTPDTEPAERGHE